MSMALMVRRLNFSTQATIILPFPDIPGQVVEIHDVYWNFRTFSSSEIAIRLRHDVDLSLTLSVNDPVGVWCYLDQGVTSEGYGPWRMQYDPPYELLGPQRCDHVASAGTVDGGLTVMYTTRREGNRALWNELRRRTSYERNA